MSDRRLRVLLVCLWAAWATVILSRVWTEPEVQRMPLAYKTGTAPPPQAAGAPAVKRPARVESADNSFKPPKNIFTPIEVVKERILAEQASKQARRSAPPSPPAPPPVVVASVPPPSPEAIAAQKAREQLKGFRFLGYLEREGEPMAFISKDRAIFLLKAGEMVEGRIQVKAVEASFVKLLHLPTRVETTIPLTPEGGTRS
jgi:hypothetical protein